MAVESVRRVSGNWGYLVLGYLSYGNLVMVCSFDIKSSCLRLSRFDPCT